MTKKKKAELDVSDLPPCGTDDDGREFGTDDILVAADGCKPLAKTDVIALYADGDKAADVYHNRSMNIKSTTGESKDGQ